MSQTKSVLAVAFVVFFGLSTMAQNGSTQAEYLNIGSGNTLVGNGQGSWGNAIGYNNYAGSVHSFVVGNTDTVCENSGCAIAFGEQNRVYGSASIALGGNVIINGFYCLGAGRFLKTNGDYSMVLGYGIYGTGNAPNLFLENNYNKTLLIGFNSTKPTLTVGPSPNDYSQGSYDKTGKVGIGDIPVPELAAKLHLRSDTGEDAGMILEPKNPTANRTYIQMHDSTHILQVDNNGSMTLRSKTGINHAPLMLEGRVGVNVPNASNMYPGHALFVYGGILTDKVTIKSYGQWHDYVFDADYQLMPLSELKSFIAVNHHLPDVPCTEEVVANGVEVGEMQGVLLKKIEELTLYTLQLQEQLEQVQRELNNLK